MSSAGARSAAVPVSNARADGGAGAGVALMRDGNGTRSFETLLRYRNAAMAEFTHALRTLKALQADRRSRPISPWKRARTGPRHGRRSPSVRNRTNPRTPPGVLWSTLSPSQLRPVAPARVRGAVVVERT